MTPAPLTLPYGRGRLTITGLPPDVVLLQPPVLQIHAIDPSQLPMVLEEKVQHPIGAPKLRERLVNVSQVTIIVPDKTRKAGQSAYLPPLLDFIGAHGIPREHIRILIGLGTHPVHAPEELKALLTPAIAHEFGGHGRLAESQGGRSEDFVVLGSTSRGTPVALHRWLIEPDLVIVTGSITYHYYAGYSGGRKGILPGCAATESIRASHRLAFDFVGSAPSRNSRATNGITVGNPVYEDQVEAAAMLPTVPFLINTITDPHDRIIDLVAGDLIAAHTYGCTLVDQYYQAPLEHRADLVVASAGGYPSDINLIQSHKALDNAARACAPGGTIVLLAECSQGLGNPRAEQWATLGSANAVLRRLAEEFEIVGGTTEGLFRKCEQFDVRLISALPDHVARRFGFDFCSAWQGGTLDLSGHAPDGQILVMPAAGITFPRL